MGTTYGEALKDWRSQRRLSQLDLGLEANVSARHISFLETGRAKPSRSMVLHLCETLGVPRAARNALLNAAGFSSSYQRRALDADDMAHVRAAVDWTLQRHDPFPAMALDRHWVVVDTNRSAAILLGNTGLSVGDSLLDAMIDPHLMATALENWHEVVRHMATRLRTESEHLGGDPVLDNAAQKLAQILEQDAPATSDKEMPAVTPARYKANGTVFSFFSTLAQFGSAEDITLSELKIELMFPADDTTREALLAMANVA